MKYSIFGYIENGYIYLATLNKENRIRAKVKFLPEELEKVIK